MTSRSSAACGGRLLVTTPPGQLMSTTSAVSRWVICRRIDALVERSPGMNADDPRRERLRELRMHLDMTKAEAARLAEVSRRTWHEAEEGPPPQPAATDDRARAIAEMLALFKEIFNDGG